MSEINKFRELERKLALELEKLDSMKSDKGVQTDLEFENKLKALVRDSGLPKKTVLSLVDPARYPYAEVAEPEVKARKTRVEKVFVNPHTSEVIKTKGGNNKTLKLWKERYGANVVESWIEKPSDTLP